jgi:hypothetical protein
MEDKVRVYEYVLHQLDLCAQTGQTSKLYELLSRINDWSYAHRAGNGELDEDTVERNINSKFWKLE